ERSGISIGISRCSREPVAGSTSTMFRLIDSVAASCASTRPPYGCTPCEFNTYIRKRRPKACASEQSADLELPARAQEQLILQCSFPRSVGEIEFEPTHPAEDEQSGTRLIFKSHVEVREIIS